MNAKNILVLVALIVAITGGVIIYGFVKESSEDSEHSIIGCTTGRIIAKNLDTREVEIKTPEKTFWIGVRGKYGNGTHSYYSQEFVDFLPENEDLEICYSEVAIESIKIDGTVFERWGGGYGSD